MYKGIIDHIEWERVHLTLSGTLTEIRSEEEKEDLIRLREFAIDVKNMDKYNYNTGRIWAGRNTHDEYRRENQSDTFSKKRRP